MYSKQHAKSSCRKNYCLFMSTEPWIKFCEPSYVRLQSIAEFWNTFSSFAYCLTGLFFAIQTERFRKTFPQCFPRGVIWRYRLCALSWQILGFGSAAFHAYQTVPTELWDEIGMFLVSFTTSFGLFDLHPLTTSRKASWFYGALTLFVITTILIYVNIMYHPFFAMMFMVSVLIPVTIGATLPMNMNRGRVKLYKEKDEVEQKAIKSTRDVAVQLAASISPTGTMAAGQDLTYCVICALVGYTIWHIDQKCVRDHWAPQDVNYYEFNWFYWCHPAWHTLTALGAAFACDAMLKIRVESFLSPLLRRDGTGSFVPEFSIASSLKLLFNFRETPISPRAVDVRKSQ